MDIQHPEINRIERIGYPNPEYLEWELRQANEPNVEDDEIWPDGLTLCEWAQEKRPSAGTESLTPFNLARNEY